MIYNFKKVFIFLILALIISFEVPLTSVYALKKAVKGKNDLVFTLKHNGIERTYGIHLPKNYNKKNKTPMVLYIHGGGGTIDAAYLDGLDKYSDKFGFILAIPQATQYSKFKIIGAGTAWNGGKWKGGECCGKADDVGFISQMIEELKKKYNIDSNRIYAMGISNGGLMTNRLGCELSNKIAAIATVAPAAIESNCKPLRPIPVLNIHGTADPINPFNGGKPGFIGSLAPYKRMSPNEVINTWINIDGCDKKDFSPSYKKGKASCLAYSKCKNNCVVEFCKVVDMGHTWPSGSQYAPKANVGSVSYDISMEQIWNFFKKHPMK